MQQPGGNIQEKKAAGDLPVEAPRSSFFEFEERYDDLFRQKYDFYRSGISHVVRKYLECGDLREGFGDYAR